MVETILGVITGLLGSTFGLMISAFMLFSLPLNVIALMHLWAGPGVVPLSGQSYLPAYPSSASSVFSYSQ
jgi:hypothetical protein